MKIPFGYLSIMGLILAIISSKADADKTLDRKPLSIVSSISPERLNSCH